MRQVRPAIQIHFGQQPQQQQQKYSIGLPGNGNGNVVTVLHNRRTNPISQLNT
jgi:hypothetical protein